MINKKNITNFIQKDVIKIIANEGNKTYKEFSGIKLILSIFSILCIIITSIFISSIIIYKILSYMIIILGISLSFMVLWNGLKWSFPRYMVLNYLFKSRKKQCKRKLNKLPPFRGI